MRKGSVSKELVGEWVYNGIDRVDNNKQYIKENLVSCCKKCNFITFWGFAKAGLQGTKVQI
jgi:hypothetical protein